MIEIDDTLIRRAAALASDHGLRGYDAVHCASAEQLASPDLVAAADGQLLDAWHELGIATFDPNAAGAGPWPQLRRRRHRMGRLPWTQEISSHDQFGAGVAR